jgi:hypothetical protein
MRRTFLGKLTLIGILLISVLSGLGADSNAKKEQADSILFIGNSITTYNLGVDILLQSIVASDSPPIKLNVDRATANGTVLDGLWQVSLNKQDNIKEGIYDVIVVQATLSNTGKVYYESVTADSEEQLLLYAKKFNELSLQGGARTILLMHWQFNEPQAMSITDIVRIYSNVSQNIKIEVAPIGLAWHRAQKEKPDVVLLLDPVHANVEGSYLAACVLYSTIYHKSPVGLYYLPEDSDSLWPGISAEKAAFFQHIAWDTVKEYQQPIIRE